MTINVDALARNGRRQTALGHSLRRGRGQPTPGRRDLAPDRGAEDLSEFTLRYRPAPDAEEKEFDVCNRARARLFPDLKMKEFEE